MCRSSIGTYRPPAPSTISGASVSGGTMVVASSSASSSGAAAQGDSGACLQYVGRQVQALGRQLRQPGHRVGVAGFFGHAGLHRLPVIGIPGTRQDGRDQVLPMPVSVPVTKTPARRESVFFHMP